LHQTKLKPRRAILPFSQPSERRALPINRPYVLFARNDESGSKKTTSERTRILIAEDDYLVATQMEDALTEAGFEAAVVVASAEEAVKAAVDNRVALVVMDIRLAGKRDGVDAAIELFQKHGMRCIFATAHVDAAVRQRAEAAQPLGWLQKPYSMTSLIELVREALGRLDADSRE
jgi:two-component system, response regulator PdtaR